MLVDNEWVPGNLDDGHLDYYFLVLASFMAMSIVYFYWISKDYKFKTPAELLEFEEDDAAESDALLKPDSDN